MPEGPHSFTNHSRKRLKFFKILRKIIQNISAREKDHWWQGTQYTPVSAIFAGSQIQTARRHLRQTSNLQSCLQRLLLHGAGASAAGGGAGETEGRIPGACPERRARLVLQQYQVPDKADKARVRAADASQQKRSRQLGGAIPGTERHLNQVLVLPIYCSLREESCLPTPKS